MKNRFSKTIVAGGVATVALAALLVAQRLSQQLATYQLIDMIHRLTGGPESIAWLVFFLIGVVVWPLLFTSIQRRVPGQSRLVRGLVFGALIWAGLMLLFLPIVGAGFFGLVIGWAVPAWALVQQLLYGGVLALLFEPAVRRPRRRRR